jgi:hypothetical protein
MYHIIMHSSTPIITVQLYENLGEAVTEIVTQSLGSCTNLLNGHALGLPV